MVKVSVIIPCLNVKEYFDNTIEHILKQTIGLSSLEIILVDDASTDNGKTIETLMKYENAYPDNVVVIPLEQNMRQGGARNIGVQYASGEYILFCDADDWISFGTLECLYNLAKEHDCDVVEFDNADVYNYVDSEEVVRCKDNDEFWIVSSVEERKLNVMNRRSTVGCWNKLYRASMIVENEIRFSEHVAFEEPAFTYMVRFYEKSHYYVHEILHYCLQHDGSTMKENYENHKYDNMITIAYLYSQLQARGFLNDYREEIQYIFWHWYFFSTLMFAVGRGTFYSKEDYMQLQENTRLVVPNIESNKYFIAKWGDIPELAELTYCDVKGVNMNDLFNAFATIMNIM